MEGALELKSHVEYLCEGTVLHTHAFYTLQKGKRIFSLEKPKPGKETWFEFEGTLFPPLMLLPHTWKRYGYTMEDVHTTFDKIDASYVWQIALMLLCGIYEPETASAGIRPTFQSLFNFLFISRKSVFDTFIHMHEHYIALHAKCSVLAHERPDHKPLLPKVFVSPAVFEALHEQVRSLPLRPPSFCHTVEYPQLFLFKDIHLVPVEYDNVHKLIYMVRVLPEAVYQRNPVKPKSCAVTLPVFCKVQGGGQRYVMMEEACFFAKDAFPQETETGNIKKKRKLE